jgi:hypothetical protein
VAALHGKKVITRSRTVRGVHVNLEPAECSSGGVGGSLGGFWTFEDVLGGWECSQ